MDEILIASDCCGTAMPTIYWAEHGVCPSCGEHCGVDMQIWTIPTNSGG